MTTTSIHGSGEYTYKLADGWGSLPEGYNVPSKNNEYGDAGVSGVAVDKDDRVYVVNRGSHPLLVFDRDGGFLGPWSVDLTNPHSIHIGPDGNFYVADRDAHAVVKFGPDQRLLLTLGNRNQPSDTGYTREEKVVKRASGPFNLVTGVAVNEAGDIFVSDGYGNSRVHKFSADGTLIKSWGSPGKVSPTEFNLPHGIGLDGKGRLLVCDRENDRIQVFDQDGEYLTMWTGLRRPTSVGVGPDGEVYVPELSHRLTILDGDGNVLSQWGGESSRARGQFVAPHGVAVDSRGDIYVGEVMTGARIQKFIRRR